MRICHLVTTTLESHYFANLGKGLASRGVSLHLGTLQSGPAPTWIAEAHGAIHFSLRATSRVAYPRAVLNLARLLRDEEIDILQTHLFDAGLVGVLAALLARRSAMILTRHHTDQVRLVGTRFHVALDRWMARRADHVVVLSPAVRDYMVAQDGIRQEHVDVVPQGFDFGELSPDEAQRHRVRRELGLDRQFVIGSIGHLYPTKGHRHLLAALHSIQNDIPEWRLLLVGAGDCALVESKARALGLHDRIVFAGFRSDVAACMRAMDLVVHPSLSEAFSQVIVEAMAVGTPVVATDVGSARYVLEDGRTGLLVPPGDASALARAILQFCRDVEFSRRVALAGQESVRQRFTIQAMVDAQINCYQNLLKQVHKGTPDVRSSD